MPQYANKKRQAVFERDKGICHYCKKYAEDEGTLDHIYPKSKGGANAQWNLVWACFECNQKKDVELPPMSLFALSMFRKVMSDMDIAISHEIYNKKKLGLDNNNPYQKGLKEARIAIKKVLGQKLGIELQIHIAAHRNF